MDTTPEANPRKRASTLQPQGITAIPEARPRNVAITNDAHAQAADVFERHDPEPERGNTEQPANTVPQLSSDLRDLPIEIRSLTERFLDGLFAKVHPAPLSADQLSQTFQDFYERAAAQIGIHIASLSSRIGRAETSSSKSSIKGRPRANSRAESPASINGGEMLTPSEVTDRRKARRLLELRRVTIEETVERCVCEKVYNRVWKHRSTDDEARDEKLRSRIAALSVVGIGLKELHADSDTLSSQARQTATEKEADISVSLASARKSLQLMDDEKYPLGKLQHLTAAHKGIVETLSAFFPSSSSADEILPTLIYTLITTPPDSISVISNLCYIQRFRGAEKVDGEAAYCLVNLEAAISFLETVDLSSLRSDELPEGPPKQPSQPQTPTVEDIQPLIEQEPKPETSPIEKASLASPLLSTSSVSASTRPVMPQRSISAMMQAQADKLEAGRENLLNTADKVYDSINGTLENSLKFVFGRFKDQTGTDSTALPKTLDDARRLINPSQADEEEVGSGRSTPSLQDDTLRIWPTSESRTIDLVAGRKQMRDRSADSTRSGGSGKKVAFANEMSGVAGSLSNRLPTTQESLSGAASFITSINPLNRFGVPSFPRFGRAVPVGQSSPVIEQPRRVTPLSLDTAKPNAALDKTQSSVSAEDDLNALEALAALKKIRPPKKEFLRLNSAAELRVGDVEELLQEYKRLAKAIGEAIAM